MLLRISEKLKTIDELLKDGTYDAAERLVSKLQSELIANSDSLLLMQFSELNALKNKLDELSKLAESNYTTELSKVRGKRIARMLYTYQDLTE